MAGSALRRRRGWRATSLLLIGTSLGITATIVLATAFTITVSPDVSALKVWLGLSFVPLFIVCLIGIAGRMQQRIDLQFGRYEGPAEGSE